MEVMSLPRSLREELIRKLDDMYMRQQSADKEVQKQMMRDMGM